MSELLRTHSQGGQYFDVLVVGAGHAGAQAAIALRQGKFEGTIALIGDEPDLPYERPPLSKDYLAGDKPLERLLIRPAAFWAEREVTMLLGQRVILIDAADHAVTTEGGARIMYGALVWATGGAARRLTCGGYDLRGVHTVRTRADADRMRTELADVTRAVVVGGGYIGLEAAAVLTKFGKQVTVLEAQDRVLARVAGEPLSRFYEAEHRARGVDIQLGVKVDSIEGRDGWVSGVRLYNGSVLPADMVIVGIGIVPAVEPLLAAGAAGGNGVAVDGQCRTSLPDVYAIGDCALHANGYAGGAQIRIESVQNANDQAMIAAKTIMKVPATYDSVPWFWSNQYDLKLQTVGLSIGFDDIIIRGAIAARSFSMVYLKGGHVIALDCVNSVKDYVQGKGLVLNRSTVRLEQLADVSISLKSINDRDERIDA